MKAFFKRLYFFLLCNEFLFNHHFKQFHLPFKRRIFYRRVKPGRRFHHCFFMAEGFKRIPAVVLPAATETPATKGQVMIG